MGYSAMNVFPVFILLHVCHSGKNIQKITGRLKIKRIEYELPMIALFIRACPALLYV